MQRRQAVVVSFLLAASTACSTGIDQPSGEPEGIDLARADLPRSATSPADASAGSESIDAFGLDLYRRLALDDGNIVFSPSSVAIALAMARAGARAETAAEMDAVLHSQGSDQLARGINALDLALGGRSGTFSDQAGKSLDVTLRIANAPFAQRGMELERPYLEALATRFGAGLRLVDYAGDPEAARLLIDAWFDDRTEQRIPKLLAPGVISEQTRLTLINAIYLKAPWATPFDAAATKPGPFTRTDGSRIDVPLMHVDGTLPYAEGAGWRAVELPYLGGSLAMTVVVPDDLAAFERDLDPDTLGEVISALEPRSVDLAFPRFRVETQADLSAILAALGMPLAFDRDRADFSGITTQEQLYITAVIHQANIDVDEKGTEAAAATAVVMGVESAPLEQVTLRVDRPFVFLLRDLPTGAIVFMGRVVDPAAEG